MVEAVTGSLIRDRAARIRVPMTEVAAAAGLNKHTLSNLKHDRPGVRVSTLAKCMRVIEERELALRDYLVSLHGAGNGTGNGTG
jgi:hypothetical protein